MRRFVTAGLSDGAAGPGLHIRAGGRTYAVLARPGLNGPGEDEHFAVDVDGCPQARWRACADVLYTRRPLPSLVAVRRATELAGDHPSCRVAAVALRGGGWAVSDGTAVLLLRQVPSHRPLLLSCLHAWLVAGHTLEDIEEVRVTTAL